MKQELELYIHIPFCVKKCAYCDFLSGPATLTEQKEYVAAMIREIYGYREMAKEYEVVTIFVGGGTPSVLSADQMVSIFRALRKVFDISPNAEITTELNPGSVTTEKLLAYKEVGMNRLSMGLQSVNNEELEQLGRIHTFEQFKQTYQLARELNFTNINVDLISAIPGQTCKSWEKTLHTVAKLQPEHISAYSLIIEEGTPFYEKYHADTKGCLPDEEEERRIYERTSKCLEAYGYYRYEISNYAKAGYECKHNLGYWERKNYLGIGVGAASLLNNVRYAHIRDRGSYVKELCKGGANIKVDIEVLDQKAQIEEFMFLGLRNTQGIRKDVFFDTFHISVESVYGEVVPILKKEGLLLEDPQGLRLTQRGIDISNYVFVKFLDPEITIAPLL